MSAAAPRRSATIEPRRALLTPSASPSLGPPDGPPTKRARLRSTPSSTISATPSTSNDSSVDVNSARRASTIRVLNVWAQLAERYNKRLDEDDIIDLYSGAIIKDRGVLRGASTDYQFGHIAQPDGDQDYPDGEQDPEDSDQDDDDNELSALPPSETTTDDDAPISKKELLRGVPPVSASTDTEDLREFLEAEKRRREIVGNEEDDEDMSQEQLSALRKVLEEQLRAPSAKQSEHTNTTSTTCPPKDVVDTTPTRPSACVPPPDDESEDELSFWPLDESTAVYPLARDESEQDVREVERNVIELTDSDSDSDSDSDAEFKALLVHPPRHNLSSPLRVPHPKEIQQPLQSPPDSEGGGSKSLGRPQSKIKSADVTNKSRSRHQSPCRKPLVTANRTRKPSASGAGGNATSTDAVSDQEVIGRISPVYKGKGKGKEVPPFVEDIYQDKDKTPKSCGVVSRGRKRKRIASSSTNGYPSAQSLETHTIEPKSNSQSRRKPISQNSIALPRPNSSSPPSLDEDVFTAAPFERTAAGLSRSLSSFPSPSKTRQATLSVPVSESAESDSSRPALHNCNSNSTPISDASIPVTHPYTLRLPSQPPPIFSSPYQGTPAPAHPPLPVDPIQAQQAQYLLAQAMHQLSYLISATMPAYAPYASNPGQPWQHPPALAPPAPPHAAYSTPIHLPPLPHGICPYHTPSSSVSCSGLPPSSPVQSSVSPPFEEQCARSRGRSKSRGRHVSFKINSEEVVVSREHDIQNELHNSGQKNRKKTLEVKGKGKAIGESGDSPQLEEQGSTPREVARGKTPGPPSRLKIDVPRGRSLNRR